MMADKIMVSRKDVEAQKAKVQEPELFPDGFTPLSDGLRDHIRWGNFTPNEFAVYITLHFWSNWGSGIYYGNAASIASIWAGQLNDRTTRNCLYSLREKGYINYPKGDGSRKPFNILINKYVCRVGAMKGWKLNAFGSDDLETPLYESSDGRRTLVGTVRGTVKGTVEGTVEGTVVATLQEVIKNGQEGQELQEPKSLGVSKEGSESVSLREEGGSSGRSLSASQNGTGGSPVSSETKVCPVQPSSSPAPSSPEPEPSPDYSWTEKLYRSLFAVPVQDKVDHSEIADLYEVGTACLKRYNTEQHPVRELMDWVKKNKKGKFLIRSAAQLRKAFFSEHPNSLRRQFDIYMNDTYEDPFYNQAQDVRQPKPQPEPDVEPVDEDELEGDYIPHHEAY